MTATDDGPVTPAVQRWTAKRTLDQHRVPYPAGTVGTPHRVDGRCAQCRDGGCAMLDWAKRVLTGNVGRF